MSGSPRKGKRAGATIELREYRTTTLAQGALSEVAAEYLWRHHGAQVKVAYPSPQTEGRWRLTAQGWVGSIPLPGDVVVRIAPKVPIWNLFGMLEYAYDLKSFRFMEALQGAQTLEDAYERLAVTLARRVLDRSRKGLYQAYTERAEERQMIRGRLDMAHLARKPWTTRPRCRVQHNTVDIADNQLLAWTLGVVVRSGVCTERTLPTLRRAFRALRGRVTLRPFQGRDCVGRSYNRLNQDYATLHALCRFFLEHTGPRHAEGEASSLAFLVNMGRLYERFVARWLSKHLPGHVRLSAQERLDVDRAQGLHFNVDLVLSARASGRVLAVMDTKYKASATPTSDDIAQIVAYAEALRARRAVLIYPQQSATPLDAQVGSIRVQRMAFALGGGLDDAGDAFVRALMREVSGGVGGTREGLVQGAR